MKQLFDRGFEDVVNPDIVTLMKRRIDELTDEELAIIKDYCEHQTSRSSAVQLRKQNVGGAILLQMVRAAEEASNA